MSKITRREFAAAAGAALIATRAAAQEKPAKKLSDTELQEKHELDLLEAKLERPLPASFKKAAKPALANVRRQAKERLKFKLPEGSEPCTTFIPQPARSRER